MDRTRWPGCWYRLELAMPAALEDDALGQLQLHGSRGAQTRPAGPGRSLVTAWFDGRLDAAAALSALAPSPGVEVRSADLAAEEDPGWLDESLRERGPIEAGRFVILDRPEPRPQVDGERLAIVLPRGRAFGTGEHETTWLCLVLLGEEDPGARTLDLGCGSGILAVAAALGGARSVLALDNDPAVLDVASENARLNGVAERTRIAAGSWTESAAEAPFDLLLANIHRSALVRGSGPLGAQLAAGGRAILSGFGPDDADLVSEAWGRAGLALERREERGEWCALALRKPSGGIDD